MEQTRQHFCRARNCFMIPMIIIGIFGISGVVTLLWNWIIPSITSWTAITYWQAMGLLVLCRILFGGFRFGFRKHQHAVHQHFSHHAPFKARFMEMTDEERQQFKNQWKQRCCK